MPRCFDSDLTISELRFRYALEQVERDLRISLAMAKLANDAIPDRLIADVIGVCHEA